MGFASRGGLKRPQTLQFSRLLGRVFCREREIQKLSQNRLSEVANVSRTGIILFERGERILSVEICKAMADGLNLPLSELIRRAEHLLELESQTSEDSAEGGQKL